MKIYPSKRVKNYAAKKLRNIFDIRGKVVLKHAPNIYHTGDKCFGLCYSDITKKGVTIHRIIIAEDINSNMKDYMSTLLHEYVHAWQFESGHTPDHTIESRWFEWVDFLKETQGVTI